LNYKTYKGLAQKLDHRQANYKQIVMIHLTKIGSDTKQGICEMSLLPANPNQTECKYFMSVPVWEVLEKSKGLITIDPKTKIVKTSIELTKYQKVEIQVICENQLRGQN
jgi:hypothetical protein